RVGLLDAARRARAARASAGARRALNGSEPAPRGRRRRSKGGGTLATTQPQTDLQRAELHAREAERLLKGRLGLITNYVKAEAHATLALYSVTHGDTSE